MQVGKEQCAVTPDFGFVRHDPRASHWVAAASFPARLLRVAGARQEFEPFDRALGGAAGADEIGLLVGSEPEAPGRARRWTPGRGQLNIPPDKAAASWQKGGGAKVFSRRDSLENSC
jgi:hypothetical protein